MDLSQAFFAWAAGSRSRAEPTPMVAQDGTQRWLWQHRFGEMLIEVAGEQVFVNGQAVRPHGEAGVAEVGTPPVIAPLTPP